MNLGLKSVLLRDIWMPVLRRGWTAAMVASVLILPGLSAASSPDPEVVAIGDGFEVTRGEVDALIKHMAASHFSSTEEQNVQAAVRLKLFSMEAKALGLGSPGPVAGQDTVEGMIALSELYMKKLLDEYPLSDVAVESYFQAHPEVFPQGKDVTLVPDDPLRKVIRDKIMAGKRSRLAREAFGELVEKYHVRILAGQGAPAK